MLNEDYRITPKDSKNCHVRWSAPSAIDRSWIFINGEHVLGPIFIEEIERVVKIPFALADVIKIEIHDLPDSDNANAIEISPNIKPILIWNFVPDAVRYRIYHRQTGIPETQIYDKKIASGIEHYVVTCPITLDSKGGVWHFFRVEAVDQYGNESTRATWSIFVMGLPDVPQSLDITDGSVSGTFNFLITT